MPGERQITALTAVFSDDEIAVIDDDDPPFAVDPEIRQTGSLVRPLGLAGYLLWLLVPGIANGLVIFLYRQLFLDLPTALLEAARLDGASWWRIYYSVAMPLCVPVTISAWSRGEYSIPDLTC